MADLAPLVDGARDGRALVVTGGGRGIGSRIAIQAASRGMPVAFLYHSQADAAAATQAALEQRRERRGVLAGADAHEAEAPRADHGAQPQAHAEQPPAFLDRIFKFVPCP